MLPVFEKAAQDLLRQIRCASLSLRGGFPYFKNFTVLRKLPTEYHTQPQDAQCPWVHPFGKQKHAEVMCWVFRPSNTLETSPNWSCLLAIPRKPFFLVCCNTGDSIFMCKVISRIIFARSKTLIIFWYIIKWLPKVTFWVFFMTAER